MTDEEKEAYRQFNGNLINDLYRIGEQIMPKKLPTPPEVWPTPKKHVMSDIEREELENEQWREQMEAEEERRPRD